MSFNSRQFYFTGFFKSDHLMAIISFAPFGWWVFLRVLCHVLDGHQLG